MIYTNFYDQENTEFFEILYMLCRSVLRVPEQNWALYFLLKN